MFENKIFLSGDGVAMTEKVCFATLIRHSLESLCQSQKYCCVMIIVFSGSE